MSRSLNKATLIGNVGKAPEIRATKTGAPVAKFSLATNRKWMNTAGLEQEEAQWHRVTAFGKLAEIVEKFVKKGDRLYIEGRIEYSTTEHEGVTRYWTDIVASEMIMLGAER